MDQRKVTKAQKRHEQTMLCPKTIHRRFQREEIKKEEASDPMVVIFSNFPFKGILLIREVGTLGNFLLFDISANQWVQNSMKGICDLLIAVPNGYILILGDVCSYG